MFSIAELEKIKRMDHCEEQISASFMSENIFT